MTGYHVPLEVEGGRSHGSKSHSVIFPMKGVCEV